MSTPEERKYTALLLADEALYDAKKRLNILRRSGQIGNHDFLNARARLTDKQDKIAAEIDMLDDGVPPITAPSDQDVANLQGFIAELEIKIAASETANELIDLTTELMKKLDVRLVR